jgi:hypothetical protein
LDTFALIVIVLSRCVSKPTESGLFEETILFAGEAMPYQLFWMHFTGSSCPQLLKKPKIFFYLDPGSMEHDTKQVFQLSICEIFQ